LKKQLEARTRELAEARGHLSEALEQQIATSEVLRVIERGLNFQIRFRYSRPELECFQVAFSRFASDSCCRFYHLIFTLCPHVAVVPAPSASDGKGQEDQADDRIADPHFPLPSKYGNMAQEPTGLRPSIDAQEPQSPCSSRETRHQGCAARALPRARDPASASGRIRSGQDAVGTECSTSCGNVIREGLNPLCIRVENCAATQHGQVKAVAVERDELRPELFADTINDFCNKIALRADIGERGWYIR
jgi:hypothetical protein